MAKKSGILQRQPPHNVQAEESVLGAILLDNQCMDTLAPNLAVEDFYREAHRSIYTAMLKLWQGKTGVDAITLTDTLKNMGKLEESGGPGYIAQLVMRVPTAANVGYYTRIVKDKSTLRAFVSKATELASDAYDSPHDVREFMAYAAATLEPIFSAGAPRIDRTREDLLAAGAFRFESGFVGGEVKTGFPALDAIIGGFYPGDLIILAAETSRGKTSLALSTMRAVLAQGRSVVFLSLEMTAEALAGRLLAAEASVDFARARSKGLEATERDRLRVAREKLATLPMHISWRPGAKVSTLRAEARARARQLDSQAPIGLIVVDYLQLVQPDQPSRRERSRTAEIGETCQVLKALAGELACPVLAMSQLNRGVGKRDDRVPMLADLRDSGSIEQDADAVLFLWQDPKRPPARGPDGSVEEMMLIIAKQRNGPTARVAIQYIPCYTRFEPL